MLLMILINLVVEMEKRKIYPLNWNSLKIWYEKMLGKSMVVFYGILLPVGLMSFLLLFFECMRWCHVKFEAILIVFVLIETMLIMYKQGTIVGFE